MSSQEAHSVLENEQLLNDFWNSWFSVYSGLGREVFDGDRIFLNSPQAFRNYLAWARKTHNAAWVSVQPFSERNKVTSVEKLFFDFDCPTNSLRLGRKHPILLRFSGRVTVLRPWFASAAPKDITCMCGFPGLINFPPEKRQNVSTRRLKS